MVFPLLRQSAGLMEWWSTAKYQIPSTKPGPRPEGGDSEGEILGCRVSRLHSVELRRGTQVSELIDLNTET